MGPLPRRSILAVFLGSRLLHDRQVAPSTAQAHTVVVPQHSDINAKSPIETVSTTEEPPPELTANVMQSKARMVRTAAPRRQTIKLAAPSSDNDGFVALMLCDPLICSGDEQVIRMELPGSNASSPVLADVVVGDDGLVRAMRIVN